MSRASASTGATLLGLLAVLLWSTTVAGARSLAEQVGPATGAAAVYAVGGGLALPFALRRWRRPQPAAPEGRYLLGCGALFVAYTLCLYLGLGAATSRQQALEVGLLNYLWPVLTLTLSVPLLGRRAGWLLVPGTGLALVGIVLVLTRGADLSWPDLAARVAANPAAYLLGLGAAVAWALYSNLTRRWAAGRGAVDLFLPATGAALVALAWGSGEPGAWNARAGLEAAGLGLVTGLAYAAWDVAMRRGNLVLVAAASYLTPLLSTLVSVAYLRVAPAPGLWSGCGLLVAGSLLSWRAVGTAAPAIDDPGGIR